MAANENQKPGYDWSRFLKRVDIKATPSGIYEAFASQKGLEQWFLRKALFTAPDGKSRSATQLVQKGDQYEWLWHGYDDNTVESGTILEANGKDLLKFSFGKAGQVTFRIVTEQGETLVVLEQDHIPTDEESKVFFHLGCTKGWVFYLTNLKSILEGGIDLRNKNLALQDMINA